MDYRQLLLLLEGKGLAKCKNQQQQHLQRQEGAGSGIGQLEPRQSVRQSGSHKTFFQFAKRKSFSYYSCSHSCNIIIIAIKPHFSCRTAALHSPTPHPLLQLCWLAAWHISNTFTVNSKGIMRLLSLPPCTAGSHRFALQLRKLPQ